MSVTTPSTPNFSFDHLRNTVHAIKFEVENPATQELKNYLNFHVDLGYV